MNTSEQYTLFDLGTPSGKTFQASSRPPIMLSAVSSLPLSVLLKPLKLKAGGPVRVWSADLKAEPAGAYWMLNGSAWPNDASACSLSSVLETGQIPQKYYLSARACSGILRRAEKRGKQLPTALRVALEQVAGASVGGARVEGKIRLSPSPKSDLHSMPKVGGGRIDGESETFVAEVAHSLRADGFDAGEDETGRGTPLVPVANTLKANNGGGGFGSDPNETFVPMAFHENQRGEITTNDTVGALKVGGGKPGQGYPAIAYNLRGRDGGAMPEPTDVASVRAASGGSSRAYVGMRRLTPRECARLQGFPDDYLELKYADAIEAHAVQVLHELWQKAGTYAREGWRHGVAATLLTPEVLLAGVHGGWISWEVAYKCAAGRGAISSEDSWPEGFMCALRINAEHRPTPYRRESFEQCARELGRSLSEMPLERACAATLLRGSRLWPEAQRAWPLRYALATAAQVAAGRVNVDGPRYKALGNSMAVNVMAWIGRRIIAAEGGSR